MASKMKTQTNDTTTPNVTELRAKADEALAAKTKAVEAEKEALARLSAIRNAPCPTWKNKTSEEVLAETVANLAWVRAEGATKIASANAGAALDAAEVADGDPLAMGCDAAALRSDLAELLGEEDRIRTELRDVERRRDARIAAGREAWSALDTRRRAAGLPGPTALPSPFVAPMGRSLTTPSEIARVLVQALTRRVVDGEMPAVGGDPEMIRKLLRQEDDLRVGIELAYREEEKRKAEAEQKERARAADQERARERERKEREERAAKAQADQKERDELIAAQRRREAGDAA